MIDWGFLAVSFSDIVIPDYLKPRVKLESMLYSINKDNIEEIIKIISLLINKVISEQDMHNLITIIASYRPFSYDLLEKVWLTIPDAQSYILETPFTRYISKKHQIRLDSLSKLICVECNFPEDTEEYAVAHDDIEKVVFYSTNDDFFSTYVDISIADSIDVLTLAAFCGSVRVFKFLITNGMKITEKTTEYMIKGGNFEIIEFAQNININGKEDNNSEVSIFDNHLRFAIEFHNNEIAEWLIENYKCEMVQYSVPLLSSNTFMFILMCQNDNSFDKTEILHLLDINGRGDLKEYINTINN